MLGRSHPEQMPGEFSNAELFLAVLPKCRKMAQVTAIHGQSVKTQSQNYKRASAPTEEKLSAIVRQNNT